MELIMAKRDYGEKLTGNSSSMWFLGKPFK